MHSGFTVWLTGLPSAGKSTLAEALAKWLVQDGSHPVTVLDGDDLRRTVCADLGFSLSDRQENVRRIGALAAEVASRGGIAVVAVIAPLAEMRRRVREAHDTAGLGYVEVHVDAPVEVCAARDVKGLYAAQRSGRISGLTGVDAVYEVPEHPDVRVRTATQTLDECVRAILSVLPPTVKS